MRSPNKPFTVVGDGNQTRDFTFVSDIVSALFSAANANITGEIINIGSSNTYSINRLVELLGGEVVYIPKRPPPLANHFLTIFAFVWVTAVIAVGAL